MRIKQKHLNRSAGGNAFIFFILLISGIFMAFPLVYAISSSLKPLSEFWIFPPPIFPRHPTFSNFTGLTQVMSDSWVPFGRYIFNTFLIAIVGTGGHIILASLCAYALSKMKFPGKNLIFNMIVLSLMFSGTVIAIPSYIIMTRLNMINTYFALIIPAFASPLGLYLMKQFMEQMIPDTILEAAYIDGANEWRIFWRIVMPIVKPAWLTAIIFSFQGLWTTGSTALVFREDLKTINYAMSQILAGGYARAGVASAATVVMMIVPIVIFIVTQANIVETMSASGMKE